MSDTEQIIHSVIRALKHHGYEEGVIFYRIKKFWSVIVGEAYSKRTKPEKIHQGTLYIDSIDAGYSHALKMHEEQILANIRRVTSFKPLTHLRFRTAFIPSIKRFPLPKHSEGDKSNSSSIAENIRIASEISRQIDNPALRELFNTTCGKSLFLDQDDTPSRNSSIIRAMVKQEEEVSLNTNIQMNTDAAKAANKISDPKLKIILQSIRLSPYSNDQ